jgi:hypothetical protein
MRADATVAVAIGVLVLLGLFVLACAGVMMCHWAQRHGRDVKLELQHAEHRFRFESRRGEERRTPPGEIPAHGGIEEMSGEHHLHSELDAPPASRDLNERLGRRQAA